MIDAEPDAEGGTAVTVPVRAPVTPAGIDVHQHLWPAELVEELRRRSRSPRLVDETLLLDGEPPFRMDLRDHDPAARAALDADLGLVLVSLSAPLGIEDLDAEDAAPLLEAWHAGAAALPAPFGAWASVTVREPDLDTLKGLLTGGFAGLQLPAPALAVPAAIERLAEVLRLCEQLDRPVLVHPGRASTASSAVPGWWPAVVDYPSQLQAAWWSWHDTGRRMFPTLRVCFAAGAGLAPVHHERFRARGGDRFVVDRDTFVDISSYRRQGIDALTRALGIDVLVLGSDRPYAARADLDDLALAGCVMGGAAARHAVCVTNPGRLLEGGPA